MQKTNVCTNPFSLSMTTDNTQDNNKNIHYLSNPFMPESKVGGSNTNPSTDYVHPLQMNGPIFKDFSSYPSLFSNAIPSHINYSKVPGNPFSNETTETAPNIQNKNQENHSVETKKESIHDNTVNVDKEQKNENDSCYKTNNEPLSEKEKINQQILKEYYNDPLDSLKNLNLNDYEMIAMPSINNNKGLSFEEIKAKEMHLRKNKNKDNEFAASNIIPLNDVFAPKKKIFEQPSINEVLILEQPKDVRQFNNIDKERRLSEDNTSQHTRYDHLMKNQTIKPNMNDYMRIVVAIKEPSFTTFAIRIQKDTSFFNFKQSICKILKLKDARFMNFTPNMFYLKKDFYIVKETALMKQSSIKNNDSLMIILKEIAVIKK